MKARCNYHSAKKECPRKTDTCCFCCEYKDRCKKMCTDSPGMCEEIEIESEDED